MTRKQQTLCDVCVQVPFPGLYPRKGPEVNKTRAPKRWLKGVLGRVKPKTSIQKPDGNTDHDPPTDFTLELGSFGELLKRTFCPLCRAMVKVIVVSRTTQARQQHVIPPDSIIASDHLKSISNMKCALKAGDYLQDRGFYHNYIIQLEDGTSGELTVNLSDAYRVLAARIPQLDLGPQDLNPQMDFKWAKLHIRSVEPAYMSSLTSLEPTTFPMTLIDVNRKCLVRRTEWDVRYVALSYVWGQTSIPVLLAKSDNVESLFVDGALNWDNRPEIPQVARDSMVLVQKLSETYLWVDALCIVQDDPDIQTYLNQMDRIYMRSLVTIVALSGQTADWPLPGVQPGSRMVSPSPEVVHGIRLFPRLPMLDTAIEDSVHATRGWTFQETCLAPRCLYFSAHQVFFVSQNNDFDGIRPPDDDDSIFEFYNDKLRDHVARRELASIKQVRAENSWDRIIMPQHINPLRNNDGKFGTYVRVIDTYTRRQLSFESDICRALAGISSYMQLYNEKDKQNQHSRFVANLPVIQFNRALLWHPDPVSSLTDTPAVSNATAPSFRRRECNHELGHCFPSWSWAGWVGHVTYDVLMTWRERIPNSRDPEFFHFLYSCLHRPTLKAMATPAAQEEVKLDLNQLVAPIHDGPCCIDLKTVFEPGLLKMTQGTPDLTLHTTSLSFWAFQTPASKFRYDTSNATRMTLTNNLNGVESHAFTPVVDGAGNRCGALMMDPSETAALDLESTTNPGRYRIMLLAATRVPAKGRQDDIIWTSYPDYWTWCRCLLYVMLIERKESVPGEAEIFERVAIGQLHPTAWKEAKPVPEFIVLL